MSAEILSWQSELRAALFNEVNEGTIRELARGLVDRARGGDMQATRLLFSYVLGSPNVTVNATNAMVVSDGRPGPAALLRQVGDGPGPGDPDPDTIRRETAQIRAEAINAKRRRA